PQLEDEHPPTKEKNAAFHRAKDWLNRVAPSHENALQAVGLLILITALSYSGYYISASRPQAVTSVAVPERLADQAQAVAEEVPPAPASETVPAPDQTAALPAPDAAPVDQPASDTQL